MATPHDALFHYTFRHPAHAGPWLRSVLPAEVVGCIDWQTLSSAPERRHGQALRQSISDLLFTAARADQATDALLLVEHRRYLDDELPNTMLRYFVHLDQGRRRDESQVPVIAIVCYHGTRPLRADADEDDPLAALQPRLPFFVDDLGATDEAALMARDLTPLGTLTLLALAVLPGLEPHQALAAIDRWGELLRATDRDPGPPFGPDAIDTFGWYVLHVTETPAEDLHMAMQRNLQRPEEKIVSTAQRLREEGLAEGRAEGQAEGLAEGLAEGRVTMLLRLLQRRFGTMPAAVEDRLRAASIDELDHWADRILDAESLEAVFGDR